MKLYNFLGLTILPEVFSGNQMMWGKRKGQAWVSTSFKSI